MEHIPIIQHHRVIEVTAITTMTFHPQHQLQHNKDNRPIVVQNAAEAE